MDKDFIKCVEEGKQKKGWNQFKKHCKGIRLTQRHAIYAKCYDCNGFGDSLECDIETCALLPYSQYRKGSDSRGKAPAPRREAKKGD